jgi:hypothetical protein
MMFDTTTSGRCLPNFRLLLRTPQQLYSSIMHLSECFDIPSLSKMTHHIRQTYTNGSGPTKFQQLQLGASKDGELILVQQAPKDSMQDFSVDNGPHNSFPSKSPIANLPDELLDEICRVAVAGDLGRPGYLTCALAFSRVCKSFHRIAQPLLFKNIDVVHRHSFVPDCIATRRLYRAIKANPALGTLCRSLSVHISGSGKPKPDDYILAGEILSWLPNLTSFSLHGGFGHPQTWPLVKEALQHMPCIASLEFSRDYWDLHLAPVCDIIQTMQLQSLTLYGISPAADRIVWALNSKVSQRTISICVCIAKFWVKGA